MNKTLRALWVVTQGYTLAAGVAIMICAFLVLIEVVGRKVFNASFGIDEILDYTLASSAAASFSYSLFRGVHVRITSAYSYLSPRWRSILDIVAAGTLVIFAVVLAYHATRLVGVRVGMASVSNTQLRVPLVIPMTPWLVGIWLFTICCFAFFGYALLEHIRGRFGALEAVYQETKPKDEPWASKEAEVAAAGVA